MKIIIEHDEYTKLIIDLDNPNITPEWMQYYNNFINKVVTSSIKEFEECDDSDLCVDVKISRC